MKKYIVLLLLSIVSIANAQQIINGKDKAAWNSYLSPFTGTWNGSVISGTYGGTGVNNGSSTITLGGSLTTSGSFTTTFTVTGNTSVTLPTTGTLVNTAVTTLSSLTSIGSTPTLVTPSITTGFTIGGVAASGTFPRGNGTNFVASTLTIPNTSTTGDIFVSTGTSAMGVVAVNATANKMLLSGASAVPTWSTSTIPTSAGATANKVLLSDGTNYVLSTPTFPNASATTRKKIVSDGTNWVASTETWAVPGSSGNVLTSDGTNWVSSTPASGTTVTAITADQTAVVNNTYVNNKSGSQLVVTLPAAGSVGQIVGIAGGSNASGWRLGQNASDVIYWGAFNSTAGTGGYWESVTQYDYIVVMYIAANKWLVIAAPTTLNKN